MTPSTPTTAEPGEQAGSQSPAVAPLASLRARLTLIILAAFVPAILFLVFDTLAIRQQVRNEAHTGLVRLTTVVADSYSKQLEEAQRLLAAIALFPEVQTDDAEGCSARLAQLVALYQPQYRGFGVSNLQGEMFCTSAPVTTTIQIADRLWFRDAVRTGEFAIGEYAAARPSGLPTLGLGYPVLDASGAVTRVVSHGLLLSALQAEADDLPLPEDAVLTITDHNGIILVRTPDDEQWTGKQWTLADAQIVHPESNVVLATGVDGVQRLYATAPLVGPSGAQVRLSIGRTPAALYADETQAILRSLISVGSILLITLLALWFGSNRLLLRRIDQLGDASARLAAGDWQERAPVRPNGDELDRLALAFNQMADALLERQNELEARERHLHQARDAAQAAAHKAQLTASRIAQIQAVTTALASALTPAQVIEVILHKGGAALNAAAMSVKLRSADGQWLESPDIFDYPEEIKASYQRYPLTASAPMADAARTAEAIWMESEATFMARYPNLRAEILALKLGAAAAIPLVLGDRVIGALGISFTTDLQFDAEEREYLLTLANQCAQALERARLYALEQQARVQLEERVRERTAELERSNRELNQFAYVASHDLKAPLRAIDNLAGWIAEDAANVLPPRSAEHLLKLRSRVRRMDRLLDDLLAYSRAGRTRPPAEEVDLSLLVQDIANVLAPPPGFTITWEGSATRLRTPRVSLELVLRNLIGNAIKHHHAQNGAIRVRAVEQGEWMEFTVSDDGPGIESQYHERIFEMYQTLKPRDQTEGSGMGLSIVKKLIESYGGTIAVQSDLGQGATFRFTWPRSPTV